MTGFSALLALFFSAGSVVAPPDTQSVIGGEPSPSCAWPTTVSLGGCTGTLIHPEVVVYAAHCGPDIPSVWFGEVAFSGPGRQVATSECHVNPASLDGPFERHEDWAFCRLAEPVTDVPIVPPLMGCETTLLTPGRPVTVVGFGLDENDQGGVKRQGETELQWIDENGAVVAGNGEVGSCFGDSGGPIYLQMPDGSWRVFGIVSGGFECGFPAWYATVHTAIPVIEETLGIDVTPCHYASGGWNPSPACADFPTDPANAKGGASDWASGCGGGPLAPSVDTCGPAFDMTDDETGPVAAVIEPSWGDVFDSDPDSGVAPVDIEVDASDLPAGVERVTLRINGAAIDGGDDLDPPFQWSVTIPPGVWELSAEATDWAGNVGLAPVVMIGVDEDPPAMPEPEGSTGGGSTGDDIGGTAADSTGDPSDGGMSSSTTGESPDGGTSSSGASQASAAEDSGCGCTSGGPGGAGAWLWLVGPGLLRRRRASLAIGAVLAATGCDADAPATGGSTGTAGSSSTTGVAVPPSSSSSSTGVEASGTTVLEEGTSSGTSLVEGSESGENTTAAACEPGTQGCACFTDDFGCLPDLRCELDVCIACPAGTLACRCVPAEGEVETGTCEGDMVCVNDLCAVPPPCPFVRNGVCDEGVACFEGSDVFDCCATQPGVCEEASAGGKCPDGSDPEDCVKTPRE